MLDAAPRGADFLRLMMLYAAFLAAGFGLKAIAKKWRPAPPAAHVRKGIEGPKDFKGPGIAAKFTVFFLFQTALLGLAFWWLPGLAFFFLVLFAFGAKEVTGLRAATYPVGYRFRPVTTYGLLGLFGLSLAAYLGFAADALGRAFPPSGGWPFLAFLFLLVAIADGYSQITGEILGGAKIVPRISPGKTWSGFLGGLVFCALAAWVGNRLLFRFPADAAFACLGAATGALAFFGDISASWVKRRMGLKDFSNLLGSQGGVLDRGDSLIWLGPALWAGYRLLQAARACASNG